jgi:hypothetical protein
VLRLPVSARLALWATVAYAGQLSLPAAVAHATGDADHVSGILGPLEVWRDLGERVVLVSLPRPGDATTVPRGNPDLVGAATDARECAFVPGIGAALVPSAAGFGPANDRGTSLTWTAYDCDPWPRHRVEELSVNETELRLREELAERTRELDAIDGTAYPSGGRQLADLHLRGETLGLPDGVPARAQRTIALAAQVCAITALGRSPVGHTVDSHSTQQRTVVLTALQAAAERALEAAVNVSVLSLAGSR